ncbi:MAG TPA: hypothetical protein ENJ82_02610, partial [Bacteroidetes bacterium]|nr:hypothetical protein [Bacteroidota bacterium]
MINSLLTMAICFSLNTANAQKESQVVSDTVEITMGNKTLSIITDSTDKGPKVRLVRSQTTAEEQ